MSDRNGGSNPREKALPAEPSAEPGGPLARPSPWPVIVVMAMLCLTVVAVVYIVAG